jgi:hypothetical protein
MVVQRVGDAYQACPHFLHTVGFLSIMKATIPIGKSSKNVAYCHKYHPLFSLPVPHFGHEILLAMLFSFLH